MWSAKNQAMILLGEVRRREQAERCFLIPRLDYAWLRVRTPGGFAVKDRVDQKKFVFEKKKAKAFFSLISFLRLENFGYNFFF